MFFLVSARASRKQSRLDLFALLVLHGALFDPVNQPHQSIDGDECMYHHRTGMERETVGSHTHTHTLVVVDQSHLGCIRVAPAVVNHHPPVRASVCVPGCAGHAGACVHVCVCILSDSHPVSPVHNPF